MICTRGKQGPSVSNGILASFSRISIRCVVAGLADIKKAGSPNGKPARNSIQQTDYFGSGFMPPALNTPTIKISPSALIYTFIDAGKSEIDQNRGSLAGNIDGDYDTNYIKAFGLRMNWKF